MTAPEVRAGSLAELQSAGRLLTKVGTIPVVVFWHDGAAYAIEDRCPHLGFPLHQGTVEAGLVTGHWPHARFDPVSGDRGPSPATGTPHGSSSCRDARSTCGPTMRAASTPTCATAWSTCAPGRK